MNHDSNTRRRKEEQFAVTEQKWVVYETRKSEFELLPHCTHYMTLGNSHSPF